MKALLALLDNTVGQKIITAATGLGLIAFVVGHLLGNLQMFLGPDAINNYAAQLKSLGPLLWVARIGLLALILLHISMTVRLALRNRRANPVTNRRIERHASTRSSRYMIISGSFILIFVIFHLLHFTMGVVQPAYADLTDADGRHDVYTMVVRGFQNWAIAGFYVVAMVMLLSHLTHATFSVFQTLGVLKIAQDSRAKTVAKAVALVLALGFISIPVAVLLRLITA